MGLPCGSCVAFNDHFEVLGLTSVSSKPSARPFRFAGEGFFSPGPCSRGPSLLWLRICPGVGVGSECALQDSHYSLVPHHPDTQIHFWTALVSLPSGPFWKYPKVLARHKDVSSLTCLPRRTVDAIQHSTSKVHRTNVMDMCH